MLRLSGLLVDEKEERALLEFHNLMKLKKDDLLKNLENLNYKDVSKKLTKVDISKIIIQTDCEINYTKLKLIEYCKSNKITVSQKLNKGLIIKIIVDWQEGNFNNLKTNNKINNIKEIEKKTNEIQSINKIDEQKLPYRKDTPYEESIMLEKKNSIFVPLLSTFLIGVQFIAYYSVYSEKGFFGSYGDIFWMTLFPPYAWYVAAEFVGIF